MSFLELTLSLKNEFNKIQKIKSEEDNKFDLTNKNDKMNTYNNSNFLKFSKMRKIIDLKYF